MRISLIHWWQPMGQFDKGVIAEQKALSLISAKTELLKNFLKEIGYTSLSEMHYQNYPHIEQCSKTELIIYFQN
jgi:hypothetical protein